MVRVKNEDINASGCSSYLLLSIVASRWAIMVLHALHQDTKRYSDLSRAIPDVTQKVLTDTLRKLERSGIIQRAVYPVIPPKVEYSLTELGYSLFKTTELLVQWAETHSVEIQKHRDLYDEQH